MATIFEQLTPEHTAFIARQSLFFVATAPPDGRINLSPKGLDTFSVLDARTVCYLDLTGSGNETSAHLLCDGRITLMFCSFDAQPLILRMYGTGTIVGPQDAEWPDRLSRFPSITGVRQIVVIAVDSVQTSCGFGVPLLTLVGERPTLAQWAEAKGDEGLVAYRQAKNRHSIDGLVTHLGSQ